MLLEGLSSTQSISGLHSSALYSVAWNDRRADRRAPSPHAPLLASPPVRARFHLRLTHTATGACLRGAASLIHSFLNTLFKMQASPVGEAEAYSDVDEDEDEDEEGELEASRETVESELVQLQIGTRAIPERESVVLGREEEDEQEDEQDEEDEEEGEEVEDGAEHEQQQEQQQGQEQQQELEGQREEEEREKGEGEEVDENITPERPTDDGAEKHRDEEQAQEGEREDEEQPRPLVGSPLPFYQHPPAGAPTAASPAPSTQALLVSPEASQTSYSSHATHNSYTPNTANTANTTHSSNIPYTSNTPNASNADNTPRTSHSTTTTTTINTPHTPAAPTPPPLPHPWVLYETAEGWTYYYNPDTELSTWERDECTPSSSSSSSYSYLPTDAVTEGGGAAWGGQMGDTGDKGDFRDIRDVRDMGDMDHTPSHGQTSTYSVHSAHSHTSNQSNTSNQSQQSQTNQSQSNKSHQSSPQQPHAPGANTHGQLPLHIVAQSCLEGGLDILLNAHAHSLLDGEGDGSDGGERERQGRGPGLEKRGAGAGAGAGGGASAWVDTRDGHGRTALQIVCAQAPQRGQMACVSRLVEYGADVDVEEADGGSLLHSAVRGDNVELVQYLCSQVGAFFILLVFSLVVSVFWTVLA